MWGQQPADLATFLKSQQEEEAAPSSSRQGCRMLKPVTHELSVIHREDSGALLFAGLDSLARSLLVRLFSIRCHLLLILADVLPPHSPRCVLCCHVGLPVCMLCSPRLRSNGGTYCQAPRWSNWSRATPLPWWIWQFSGSL